MRFCVKSALIFAGAQWILQCVSSKRWFVNIEINFMATKLGESKPQGDNQITSAELVQEQIIDSVRREREKLYSVFVE